MMNNITVMKFPPYHTKKDINNINEVLPDILILDDDFISELTEFDLPNSIIYLDFGKKFNKSLKTINLPKYLKKIKFGNEFNQPLNHIKLPQNLEILQFGDEFNQSLDYVILPQTLKILQFGKKYQCSLFSVKFPNSLLELILGNSICTLPYFLPKNLEKIILSCHFDYSQNVFVVPCTLKSLRVSGTASNKVLLDNLPLSLKTLEVIYNLDFDMINLPNELEELFINIEVVADYNVDIFLPNNNAINLNIPNNNAMNLNIPNNNAMNLNIPNNNVIKITIPNKNLNLNMPNIDAIKPNILNNNAMNLNMPNNNMGNMNLSNNNVSNFKLANNTNAVEQTNLPFGLKKLKLSHIYLLKYFKKIPFDCKLVDINDQEYNLTDVL